MDFGESFVEIDFMGFHDFPDLFHPLFLGHRPDNLSSEHRMVFIGRMVFSLGGGLRE